LKIDEEGEEQLFHFNKTRACVNGHGNPGEPEPRMFSFNSPHGACPHCTGLGHVTEIDADLIIPNPDLSINEGCIRPLSKMTITGSWLRKMFEDMAEKYDFHLILLGKN
jgi:excinuclease ABC subunit A